ncbi:hypothetical protein BGZ65_003325 [Modicella reniformis]|uniref:Hyaluronan-mediated motility receptor C-terminal domain-containing protein n=1 Tax=Modicella reniformis TaxID=1440133 RepID=A0A9P6LZP0_9FUNG|nr:hypothetical protein BGZ65_003325 [Modicella reniformis]
MFSRSERFADKIDITPGPNHYDVRHDDDPYKRFGFLDKTKRFRENNKGHGPGGYTSTGGSEKGPYERNALSASLPSLVIDEDGARSPDTASVTSGCTTPEYTQKPINPRSRSADKLGQAFAANTNKTEERLKRELVEMVDKFEKYRIARQKELDVMSERQKKAETMYQSAIKDKSFIQKQLLSKESEIAELGTRHNMLKATLERSERAAATVNDKIGKSNHLQKKIDELEKLLSRASASLEEQESLSNEARQKSDQEVQQLQQQLSEQKELSEQETTRIIERQRLAEEQYEEELKRAKKDTDAWQIKFEELERLFEELKQKLEAEQRTTEELRESMKREREQLQDQIDRANEAIRRMEKERQDLEADMSEKTSCLQQEKADLESAMNEKNTRLQQEKDELDQLLRVTCRELEELTEKHRATERMLEEQRVRHADAIETMTQHHEEQQMNFSKECQEHLKARQDLEQSIAHLITQLDQNRDVLLKVQKERATLQDEYDRSQVKIQEMSSSMMTLEAQYEELKVSSKQEQQEWVTKYESLSQESASQRQKSDAAIAELEVKLEKCNEEYGGAMISIDAIHTELKAVEGQREEAIAQRIEEERKGAVALERLAGLEQEKALISQQLTALGRNKEALEAERTQLKREAQGMRLSIKSLETDVELITAEAKEQMAQGQSRIKELKDMHLESSRQVELYHEKEKSWESERTKASADAAKQSEEIGLIQSDLAKIKVERDVESRTSAERIQELEAQCRAMESTFELLFERSGSTQVIDQSQPKDIWRQHSVAVLDILGYHTTKCSSKSEHAELLPAGTTQGDNASLLARIAELEDQLRQLNVQVELLEAENIGKEAIIKALEDEYEYQEKVIRDLSKGEDAAKEVTRLEDELRRLIDHTRETDGWIQQVQEDNEKYREAYLKADIVREETLLDMAKLHEELAESEQARLQTESQLQDDVKALIKKYCLSPDELSRLSKMHVDSAQNLNLKHKHKQLTQLKEENLALKKKNLSLSNARDSLRLKCLQVERDLEAYKGTAITSTVSKLSNSGTVSCASSVISSSSGNTGATDQSPSGKLQLLPMEAPSDKRFQSTSPGSAKSSKGVNKPPTKSRAARSYMAGHPTSS